MALSSLAAAQTATRRVVLPPGTVIPVRLDQDLSSKTASVGDRFSVTVRYGQDDAEMPEGTRFDGVVREVVRSRTGQPGVLDMSFRRMVTRGGQSRAIAGSLVSLDSKSVRRSGSGRMVAAPDKSKDRLKWVGIGAGAGLLVGAVTKGNTLLDTVLGAAAGYAYNEFGNKPKATDVALKAGREFGVRLDRRLAFQAGPAVGDRYNRGANDTAARERYDRERPDLDPIRRPVLTASRRVTLPAGAVIPVSLDRAVSSRTSRVGDTLSATVSYGRDDAGMPQGTRFDGRISEAIRASNGRPGVLDMSFTRMVTDGGQSRAMYGSLVSLDDRNIARSGSGHMVATADKGKDRLKWVGIGAGAGVLVGGLTKGNVLLDAVLGAAAGYAYNEFGSKPKAGDVYLKAGTVFGVRLDRQLVFDTGRPVSEYDDVDAVDRDRYDRRDADSMEYAAAREGIGMTIDGRDHAFGLARPFMRNGQVLVPLSTVARAANFGYRWDAKNRLIHAGDGELQMEIGSAVATMNGRRHPMEATAELIDGTVYVPLQFVGMATGGSAHWDADKRTVVLTSRATN